MEAFPVAPGILIDVDKARRLVRDRITNARLSTKRAKKLIDRGDAGVNDRHWKRGKLKEEPVIMIVLLGMNVLVDGWHRARRAHEKRQKWLPAHLLSEAEARKLAFDSRLWKRKKKR